MAFGVTLDKLAAFCGNELTIGADGRSRYSRPSRRAGDGDAQRPQMHVVRAGGGDAHSDKDDLRTNASVGLTKYGVRPCRTFTFQDQLAGGRTGT